LEYEQIREVAGWFHDRALRQGNRFARGWTPEPPDPGPAPIIVDIDAIVRTAWELVAAMPEPVLHRVVPRPLDVEGATRRVLAFLEARDAFDFREVLVEHPSVVDILSTLLALLELARLGRIQLRQGSAFSEIGVQREHAFSAA
jgi:chromatin segregation and condensation protein Rec8/ScpA/Scc1 (kleisin family)